MAAGSLTRQQAYGRLANSLHHLLGANHLCKTVAAVVPSGRSDAQSAQYEKDAGQRMLWPLQCINSEQHLPAWVKERSLPNFNSDHGALRCKPSGDLPPRAPSEYDLSLGKIVDILKCDYPAMFERPPNFEIYDEDIVFELGQPFHAVSALRGKQRYRRVLSAIRGLSCSAVQDGRVRCTVADGQPYGHALRVPWTCEGSLIWSGARIHISAVSLYSIRAQMPLPPGSQKSHGIAADPSAVQSLSHRIHRHCIKFVEIHPPSIRSVLLRGSWRYQACNMDPVFALGGGGEAASTIARGFPE
mmetsp:Transcript_128393/g.256457  ORF Transcript_128393/g.256457 Transcript_128393/m.256457 type:complete len:301 (+) Transcript_128393:224-1126(+)